MPECPRPIFANLSVWDSIFSAHEHAFRSIETLRGIARELIGATKDNEEELVRVQNGLVHTCSENMLDTIFLVGNNRGVGAMKIARGMFEISVISEYLERNPIEVRAYIDFGLVEAWRHVQAVEKHFPGRVPPEFKKAAEGEYNRVRAQFSNSRGHVRARWADKNIRQMAEEVGRLNIYEIAYSPASELQHMPLSGMIGHDLDWGREALFIGHGSLLATATVLYHLLQPEARKHFEGRMKKAIGDFNYSRNG